MNTIEESVRITNEELIQMINKLIEKNDELLNKYMLEHNIIYDDIKTENDLSDAELIKNMEKLYEYEKLPREKKIELFEKSISIEELKITICRVNKASVDTLNVLKNDISSNADEILKIMNIIKETQNFFLI